VPYATNIRAAARSDVRRMLARVNKPIDREKWFMPPFMVNACFVPTRNGRTCRSLRFISLEDHEVYLYRVRILLTLLSLTFDFRCALSPEILFPSAILQSPFFVAPTPELRYGDVAVNFAAIGAVICHGLF
jgi:predicted metalloendopeptidase